MKLRIINFGLYLLLVSCCSPSDLEKALKQAGDNRAELEKVLNHYKENSADLLKYKAACFLIENMPVHYQIKGDEYLYDIMDSLNLSDLSKKEVNAKCDSIKEENTSSLVILWDLQSLSSGFLIQHIDAVFSNWDSAPWKDKISFEDFCEYVLPYSVSHEKRELWTDYYREKYLPYISKHIDAYNTSGMNLIELCNRLNDSLKVHEPIGFTLSTLPDYPPLMVDHIRSGTCDNYAARTIFIMRSLGIPAGEDFVPQWGGYMTGHSWNILFSENGYHHPFEFAFDWVLDKRLDCSKVYRNTYSIRKNSLPVRYGKEKIPDFLNKKNMTDVTSEYIPVSDVTISVEKPANIQSEVAYLCIFNNKIWIPVHWGDVKRKEVTFTDMGQKVVYLPAFYNGKNFVAANDPFILDSLGGVHFLKPDFTTPVSMALTRKFHLRRVSDYYYCMLDGKFQGANRADFSDSKNLYEIISTPPLYFNEIDFEKPEMFRYIRYIGGLHSYSFVAELEFYSKTRKLTGEIIGSEGFYEKDNEKTKEWAFDGNELTYFKALADSGGWVGLDLGTPQYISRIRYFPRNDGNNICLGDLYELFYWDKGQWNSLGQKTGDETYVLNYKNCPSNALFLLHNHTRGKEERTFSYENGEQIFW
ncbi:MAG: hypothetical protein LBT50_06420 [Prevotellaceae bacterium]|jgi:hypothetical protein|nr:hypothetical protein [Prevotellaceae bacterium]